MISERSLLELKVLVTRPEKQAVNLCALIEQSAGQAIRFPVINIKSLPVEQATIAAIKQQDFIIFISRNAVAYFSKQMQKNIPTQCRLIAVGAGTADSMKTAGLRVDLQAFPANSEGLLSLPELAQCQGSKVMIVRGQGGRELLATTLQARGASINYADVYTRLLATPSLAECQQAAQVDCVVCTSVAGVTNLCLLLPDTVASLFSKPLIVVSERIKDFALSQGFRHVMVTDEVSDQAIVQQLMKMEL